MATNAPLDSITKAELTRKLSALLQDVRHMAHFANDEYQTATANTLYELANQLSPVVREYTRTTSRIG